MQTQIQVSPTSYRLHLHTTINVWLIRTPFTVDIWHRQEGRKPRLMCRYCYASPAAALDDARLIVRMYEQAGVEIEHNLDDLQVVEAAHDYAN